MGKGSNPRPLSVDREKFNRQWEETFGKKPEVDDQKAKPIRSEK